MSTTEPAARLELAEARDRCAAITTEQARNFRYAFLFLPGLERGDMAVIYAWCRRVDDIADADRIPLEVRRASLEAEATRLRRMAAGLEVDAEDGTAAVDLAMRELLARRPRIASALDDLIAGMRQDLTKLRYESFDELHDYCYKAASTVGLACLEVFGYQGASSRALAADMGVALQLTNILRDVGEDLERGRIYLPLDELAEAGVSEAQLLERRMSPELERYLARFASRARRYYDRSERLFERIPQRTRSCPLALHRIYRELLDAIVAQRFPVLRERVRLGTLTKLRLAAGLWLGNAWGPAWPRAPRSQDGPPPS